MNAAEHLNLEGDKAIDIAATGANIPVVAAHDGVVQTVSIGGNTQCHGVDASSNGLGNYVVLRHDGPGGTLYTAYAHLASASVGVGDPISEGAQLGIMGFTGCVMPAGPSGQHVHFAVSTSPTIFGHTIWNAPDPVDNTHVTRGDPTGGTYSQLAPGTGGGGTLGTSATSYTGPVVGSYGQVVSLSAHVVDASSSGGLSGKSVAFTLGSESCSATTNGSGDASCSVTLSQAPGGYTVAASFAGDASFAGSGDSKPFTIQKAATSTSYTGGVSSEFYAPFTASAKLTDGAGGPVVGESVSFTLGGGDGCSAVTDGSGSASCSITPTQTPGSYSVVASFAGDAFYLASSDTKPFTITKAHTTTTVTALPPGSSRFGQPVTFTAVSAFANPGAPSPTGSTAFTVDANAVGAAPLSSGSASIATSSLSAGAHSVAAAYGGDADFLPSSGDLAYTVTCDVNVSGDQQGPLTVTTTTCLAPGARVAGAVIVKPGGALDVEGASVGGSIGASGGGVLRVCGSTIAGAVDVKNAIGLVLVGDSGDAGCAANTIGGALDVKNNISGVEAIDNTASGAILTDGNSGPGPYPGDATTISGNHPPMTVPPVAGPVAAPAEPSSPPARGAPLAAPSIPPGSAAVATSVPASATVTTPRAVPPVAAPRAATPAKPLTRAQKLAAAIHACGKLKKTKRPACVATARKHYAPAGPRRKGGR